MNLSFDETARKPESRSGRGEDIDSLSDLLDRVSELGERSDRVTLDMVLKAAGQRSFGVVLLVVGLIALSPLSGIPTVPTAIGLVILLLTVQLLLGRTEFWMPPFLLRQSLSREKVEKGVDSLRPVARFADRLLKQRWTAMTGRGAVYLIATICLLIALVTPLLELLPFAATTAGAGLTAFGLALISRDGLVAVAALVIYATAGLLLLGALL